MGKRPGPEEPPSLVTFDTGKMAFRADRNTPSSIVQDAQEPRPAGPHIFCLDDSPDSLTFHCSHSARARLPLVSTHIEPKRERSGSNLKVRKRKSARMSPS